MKNCVPILFPDDDHGKATILDQSKMMMSGGFSIGMLLLSVALGAVVGPLLVFLGKLVHYSHRKYGITPMEALPRMNSSCFSRDIMLLDFDDMLYPTTFLDGKNLFETELSEFPQALQERMAEIDESALALIRAC